jgi:tyrosyl-tRNA synthetase
MQMLKNTLRYFFLTKEVIELNSRTQRSSTLTYFAKRLAEEVTTMAHSALTWYAIKASNILFGNSTADDLKQLDEATFLDVWWCSSSRNSEETKLKQE